jgi:SWI/SNF related-matrix-associated actin-dependent regulator of chromatin subfamily C
MDGRYPANWKAGDFLKIENKSYTFVPDRDAQWEAKEELLLLEALEMYEDDWNKISDYVGTRTREECIIKFLQFEIEDDMVEPDRYQRGAANLQAEALSYLGDGRIPLTQVDNPVMSVVAFMTGLAEPSVTAAAAGRSIAEIQRLMHGRIETGHTDGPKGKDTATQGGAVQASEPTEAKADDNMEVEVHGASKEKDVSKVLATIPLALGAARSSALASHEERTLTKLVHTATNLQIQKQDLKLEQFAELEHLLKLERKDLERRRQSLFLERLEFQRRMKSVEDAFEKALTLDSAEGLKSVREVVRSAVSGGNLSLGRSMSAEGISPLGDEAKTFNI